MAMLGLLGIKNAILGDNSRGDDIGNQPSGHEISAGKENTVEDQTSITELQRRVFF